jgi:hypothetical protein
MADAGPPTASQAGAGLSPAAFPSQVPRSDAPCLAKVVTGNVQTRGGQQPIVVVSGAAVSEPGWLTVAPGARLLFDVPPSLHELSVTGPAVVDPCTRGEEHLYLLQGRVESAAASPVPRADEWIVSPFSVTRFRTAVLKVNVDETRAVLEVTSGEAAAMGERDEAFATVQPGATVSFTGAPVDVDGAAVAVARCEADARNDRALDLAPGSADARARASEAHEESRARCAMARLRTKALPDTSEPRASLTLRLDAIGPL